MKSEALEAKESWTVTYLTVRCPYCRVSNRLSLGDLEDITAPDIDACKCYKCEKKFWLPDSKEMYETSQGIGPNLDDEDPVTAEELGLNPGDDLIEHAYCEDGQP